MTSRPRGPRRVWSSLFGAGEAETRPTSGRKRKRAPSDPLPTPEKSATGGQSVENVDPKARKGPSNHLASEPSHRHPSKSAPTNAAPKATGTKKEKNAFEAMMSAARRRSEPDPKRKRGALSGPSNYGSKRSYSSCPKYKIVPHTAPKLVVDGFQFADRRLSRLYVLTHFHSDHYGGLGSDFDAGVIYATPSTCELVATYLRVPRQRLRPTPLETPVRIEQDDGRSVSLTFVDANHCPGSAMVVVEVEETSSSIDGKTGKAVHSSRRRVHLHTGDMRWERLQLLSSRTLARLMTTAKRHRQNAYATTKEQQTGQQLPYPRIHSLFLDTTYCDTMYRLPPQRAAVDAVVRKCRSIRSARLKKEMTVDGRVVTRKCLIVFGSYSIGKERVFLEVGRDLREKVAVDSKKMRMMRILEKNEGFGALYFGGLQKASKSAARECRSICDELLTTNRANSGIWVLPMGRLGSLDSLRGILSSSEAKGGGYTHLCAFRPTGWAHKGMQALASNQVGAGAPVRQERDWDNGRIKVFGVAYSEHSSFEELCDCVMDCYPQFIVPTVQARSAKNHVALLREGIRESEPFAWESAPQSPDSGMLSPEKDLRSKHAQEDSARFDRLS